MKDIFCDIVGIGAGTILVGLQIWLAASSFSRSLVEV